MVNKKHFSEEELRRFMFKEVPDETAGTIKAHIKECSLCRNKFDGLFIGFLMSRNRNNEEGAGSTDDSVPGDVAVLSTGDGPEVFGKGIVTLGGSSGCDLKLSPSKTGDARCSIIRQGGDYFITDNGTGEEIFLNGLPVKLARLAPGDRIKLGQEEVVFSTLDQPAPGPYAWLALPEGGRFKIDGRKACFIGKAADNQIVIPGDPYVSKHHARISFSKERWVLCDLRSKNGTFVNGRRIGKINLRGGEKITLGKTHLRFILR